MKSQLQSLSTVVHIFLQYVGPLNSLFPLSDKEKSHSGLQRLLVPCRTESWESGLQPAKAKSLFKQELQLVPERVVPKGEKVRPLPLLFINHSYQKMPRFSSLFCLAHILTKRISSRYLFLRNNSV